MIFGEMINEASMCKYKDDYEDGFYGKNIYDPEDPIGIWNSISWKGDKAYRERAEVLVLNDKDEIYIGPPKKNHKDYTIPGGSTEPGIGPKDTAIKETREEALIEVKDIRLIETYEDNTYHKELTMIDNGKIFRYDGMVTHLFVARFDKKFTGEVAEEDRDVNMATKGKWVKIDKLNTRHKKAVEKYLKNPKKQVIMEGKKTQKIFFISKTSMNEDVLAPRIPENYFTKNGFEDNKTPRICFSETIDGALMGLGRNLEGETLYVHTPEVPVNIIRPTTKQVPDCGITKEVWVTEKVALEYQGKIKVGITIDEPIKFRYGNNTAELFKWNWQWVKKYGEFCEDVDCLEEVVSKVHKNSKKRVSCPYCSYRNFKLEVIDHIESEHEDLIPEGYTPARLVFNKINHKESGLCTECKKNETKWNDSTWRYERYCSKKCYNAAAKRAKENMKRVYGKEHLLDDPEYQSEKMLKNRKISGNYTWSDGTVKSYCGSYEKNLLEHMDKVLSINSEDIETPGPIIQYEFEGKTLHWITDLYYAPANLAFDVKDGGNNPNNRDMPIYRAKQKAKEKAIIEQGKYNYIRLTDNDFGQLLIALAVIRESLTDTDKTTAFINEYMSCAATGAGYMVGTNQAERYIVQSMVDDAFVDTYYSKDRFGLDMYKIKDKKLKKTSLEEIKEETGYTKFLFFRYKGSNNDTIEEAYENQSDCNFNFFYKSLTENVQLGFDSFLHDDNFELVLSGDDIFKENAIIEEKSLELCMNRINGMTNYLELFDENDIRDKINLLEDADNMNIFIDTKGYFVYNESTYRRSDSYKNINEIPKYIIDLLK